MDIKLIYGDEARQANKLLYVCEQRHKSASASAQFLKVFVVFAKLIFNPKFQYPFVLAATYSYD